MDFPNSLESVRLVKVGSDVLERLERWIASRHHKAVVCRLQRFREGLERDMEPEPWTALEGPMVLLLVDVCEALALTRKEREVVLGKEGERSLVQILDARPVPGLEADLNERQAKAMAHVLRVGAINLSTCRELCPNLSDETLRLDLADLVKRGLLAKNGAKRGTFYTPAARSLGS